MMDLDSDMLEMYYPGLGDIAAKQFLAKAPVMSYAVNEYVFMQCENEDDAARAAEILQTRIDTQAGGDAFYPETIDQWKAARGRRLRTPGAPSSTDKRNDWGGKTSRGVTAGLLYS